MRTTATSPDHEPIPASTVAPATIGSQCSSSTGAEVLIRDRPPGAVALPSGHREHVLLCNSGQLTENADARSVLRAEGTVREWSRLPRHDVTFIPATMPLEWEWNYRSKSTHLVLDPVLVEGVREQMADESPGAVIPSRSLRPLLRNGNAALRRTLGQLRDEAFSNHPGQRLLTSSLVTTACVQLLRSFEAPTGKSARPARRLTKTELRRAMEAIESTLIEGISLPELASTCGVSTFHFARAFKETVGCPPHEYQIRRRVERAEALLLEVPRRSIAEIAAELGFVDQSHLSRHFKRIVGVPPGRFRA